MKAVHVSQRLLRPACRFNFGKNFFYRGVGAHTNWTLQQLQVSTTGTPHRGTGQRCSNLSLQSKAKPECGFAEAN